MLLLACIIGRHIWWLLLHAAAALKHDEQRCTTTPRRSHVLTLLRQPLNFHAGWIKDCSRTNPTSIGVDERRAQPQPPANPRTNTPTYLHVQHAKRATPPA